MKLTVLHERSAADLKQALGLRFFKRQQDPLRRERNAQKLLPYRSGNQDTPLSSPRLRRYFNAPIGATQGKLSLGTPLGGELAGGDAGPVARKGPHKSGFLQRRGLFDRP
jgi:hypothetical protein